MQYMQQRVDIQWHLDAVLALQQQQQSAVLLSRSSSSSSISR